uniref:CRC domain-containing protein n=2 Tax=Globodera rostochiensis TaxID=31243 RepID=A0A914HT76_GLORO
MAMLKWEKRRDSGSASVQQQQHQNGNSSDTERSSFRAVVEFGGSPQKPAPTTTTSAAAQQQQLRTTPQQHNVDCYNSYWRNATSTPQPHYYTAGGTGSLVYSTISDAQSICSSTFDVSARLSNPTVHHHHIDQYNNILPMSSPSGTGAGTIGHHQTNSMAAATAQISAAIPAMPFCCECHATQNRCSTDSCPCFATRRMCDEHCESARYRGDCLNQAICKCSCEADPAKPAKNVCTKSCCDCLRIKESCSKLCACKQICKNKEPPKRAAKVNKPAQGCQCAKGKKQCGKKECQCRGVYEFCSSSCKCGGDCANGASKFHVPKHVQNCFLEHKHESSGLIVTLIGDGYIYRGDFFHDSKNEPHVEEQLVAAIYDLISKYKVDLYEIVIFVSKSPCFHQDCDPKCEVVDECKCNKACAKLLGLLLSKVRKELSKVDVRMTVKFLYPHLNRGDLYTKQGILSMLQSGIKVEPLLMKDWSAVMDWAPHPEHKGEYLQLWGSHNLDRVVAQSQAFINECRRALGLSMKFWVAEIHEIVKNTILHYTEIRGKCNELNDALKQLDLTATPHKIRTTPSKRRSFIDMHELRDKLLMRGGTSTEGGGGKGAKNGSSVSVASEEAHAQAMVASFCGRSFDDGETNEIAQRIRKATASINMEIESLMEFLAHKGAIG